MASEWKSLATLLGLTGSEVNRIKCENSGSVNDCLAEMLYTRQQQTNPFPTWSALANAVERLGNQRIAQEIRSMHC